MVSLCSHVLDPSFSRHLHGMHQSLNGCHILCIYLPQTEKLWGFNQTPKAQL